MASLYNSNIPRSDINYGGKKSTQLKLKISGRNRQEGETVFFMKLVLLWDKKEAKFKKERGKVKENPGPMFLSIEYKSP